MLAFGPSADRRLLNRIMFEINRASGVFNRIGTYASFRAPLYRWALKRIWAFNLGGFEGPFASYKALRSF